MSLAKGDSELTYAKAAELFSAAHCDVILEGPNGQGKYVVTATPIDVVAPLIGSAVTRDLAIWQAWALYEASRGDGVDSQTPLDVQA